MRCEDFESRLHDVLDERRPLSSAADIEEHIGRCGGCRELLRAYEAVFIGLRQAAPPAEISPFMGRPADLTRRADRTRQIVAQARRPRLLRPPARRRAVLAAAALLLAAVGVSWLVRPAEQLVRPPGQIAQPPLAGDSDSLAGSQQGPSGYPRGETSDEQRRQAGPAIAAQSVAALPSATASLDSSHAGDLNAGDLNAGDLMRSLPGAHWAQGVADGLEPVTSPTVGAISGFLNLWGVGDEGRRS